MKEWCLWSVNLEAALPVVPYIQTAISAAALDAAGVEICLTCCFDHVALSDLSESLKCNLPRSDLYIVIPRLQRMFLLPAFFGLPRAPYQAIQQSCHQSRSPSAKLLNTLWVASEKGIHTVVVDLTGPNCLAKNLLWDDLGIW